MVRRDVEYNCLLEVFQMLSLEVFQILMGFLEYRNLFKIIFDTKFPLMSTKISKYFITGNLQLYFTLYFLTQIQHWKH